MQRTRIRCVLSAVDLHFLTNVVQRLDEQQLHVYQPGSRRAAAALILRFGDDDQREVNKALASWHTHRKLNHNHNKETSDTSHDDASGGAQRLRGLGDLMMDAASPLASSSSSAAAAAASASATTTAHASAAPRPPALAFLEYLADRVGVSDVKPSSLKLLFMKRADRAASRWSGQIAFPGGQRDPDDDADDLHTVQREVYEELGMPLENTNEFVNLGRMRDDKLLSNTLTGFGDARSMAMSASSAATTQGVVQAQFVYLHVGDMTPSVHVARHEVESVQWMPISRLTPAFVSPDSVCHPLSSFVVSNDADKRLILSEFFQGAMLAFPSISMPAPRSASSADAGSDAASHTPQGSWRVWGQTLRSASALVLLDDRAAIDWPLFSAKNSAVLQTLAVDALHGYYEVCLAAYRVRAAWQHRRWFAPRKSALSVSSARARAIYAHGTAPQRRHLVLPTGANPILYAAPETMNVRHVGCFLLDVALVLFCAYFVAALIYTVATAVRIALGWEEDARGSEARRLAYHASQTPPSVERQRRVFAARNAAAAAAAEEKDDNSTSPTTATTRTEEEEQALATRTPDKREAKAVAAASEDALAAELSSGDSTASASARPASQRGGRHADVAPVVQFGFLQPLLLVSLIWLLWNAVKVIVRIDWLGTFEDDEALLNGGETSPLARPPTERSSPSTTWQDQVGHQLDRVLIFLRTERAKCRRANAHFKAAVQQWVKVSVDGDSHALKQPISFVPTAAPAVASARQQDSESRAADSESSLWFSILQGAEDALNGIAGVLVDLAAEYDVRNAPGAVPLYVKDRADRMLHTGFYANEGLLARAWLYQNKASDSTGAPRPRQDWQPLGLPSRRREEHAVQGEMEVMRNLAGFVRRHESWPGSGLADSLLRFITESPPNFSVWKWAHDREMAKNLARRRPSTKRSVDVNDKKNRDDTYVNDAF